MENQSFKEKKLVSIGEAAKILGVSIDTVRRWDRNGILHSSRPSGKNRYFSIEELEKVKFSKPLSISEAAKQLGISESTLRRLEEKGLINPERNNAGERIYSRGCLEKFLKSDYFLRQKEIQSKILEPLEKRKLDIEEKPKGQKIKTRNKILGAEVVEQKEKIFSLINFKKIFLKSGLFLIMTFIFLVTLFTVLFLLYPENTAKWLGYRTKNWQPIYTHLNHQDIATNSNNGKILGAQYPEEKKEKPSQLGKLLKPISTISLKVVKLINPEIYDKIVPEKLINNINDVLSIDDNDYIVPLYTFTFPDTSYLKIPDTNLIENLNADYLRGKVPGSGVGDLVVFDEDNTIFALKINGTNLEDGSIQGGPDGVILDSSITFDDLADNSITTSKLADGSVTTSKISDLSITAAKIATGTITGTQVASDGSVTKSLIAGSEITVTNNNDGSWTISDSSGGEGDVVIAPTSAQEDTTTRSTLNLNKTGSSGNLIQMAVNGTDTFIVDYNGIITTGTWQASIIQNSYITNTLSGKTYNGLSLTSNIDGFSVQGGTTSRTLNISGSDVTINQSLQTTDSPTFAGATFTAFPLTPNQAPISNYQVANKKYVDDNITTENHWDRNAGTSTLFPHNANDNVDLGSGNFSTAGLGTFTSLTVVNNINEFSTDGTLAGDSDTALPTEKATKTYVDAQVIAHDTFLELTDTPAAYTADGAIYVADNTTGEVDESTVILTEAANTFTIAQGTASLDIAIGAILNIDTGLQTTTNAGILAFTAAGKTLNVEDTSTVNQDLTTDANVTFGGLTINGDSSLDGAVVINEAGADKDFRVEGVGQANALFVQGSDGFTGLNTNAPTAQLDVNGDARIRGMTSAGIVKNDTSGNLSTGGAFTDLSDVTTANVTYYVDDALGDDSNDGLAAGAGHALKTIQAAINKIPRFVKHNMTINVADGTYESGSIVIYLVNRNIIDGKIDIIGNITNPENVIIRSTRNTDYYSAVSLNFQGSYVKIRGFQVERTGASANYQIGVVLHNGVLYLDDMKFNKTGGGSHSIAIWSHSFGRILAENCATNGTGYYYGYYAYTQGLIEISGTQLTATNYRYYTLHGGQIFGSDVWHPDYANQKFEIYATLDVQGDAIFNEAGADNDFRVEGVGSINALFVQGSDGFVGINNGVPDERLTVGNTNSTVNEVLKVISKEDAGIQLIADTDNVGEDDNPYIFYSQDGGVVTSVMGLCDTGKDPMNNVYTGVLANAMLIGTKLLAPLQFGTLDNVRMTINTTGKVGIGTNAPNATFDMRGDAIFNEAGADKDFRVEGVGQANALFVQGSDGFTGLNTNAPTAQLDINGDARIRGMTSAGIVKNDTSGNLSTGGAFTDLSDVTTANASYYVNTLGNDANAGSYHTSSAQVNISFVNATNKIVRAAGSFVTNGFTTGDIISVRNSTKNNGSYEISNVTATELTIDFTQNSYHTTGSNTDVTFNDNGGAEDTITTTSTDFIAAGLKVGMDIVVNGSTSNDGTYTLTGVAANQLNVATASFTAEAAAKAVDISVTLTNDSFTDEAAGASITVDGGTALLTVQVAVNKIPRFVKHIMTINVADGIYAVAGSVVKIEDKMILKDYYTSSIRIFGNIANPENVILRNTADTVEGTTVKFSHEGDCVHLGGFQLERTGATASRQIAFSADSRGYSFIGGLKFNKGGGGTNSEAIEAVSGAKVVARNCTVNGTEFYYGYYFFYGSSIEIIGNSLTATQKYYNYSGFGGQIFGGEVWYPDYENQRFGVGTISPNATLDVRGDAIFNEAGADYDFRVEGVGQANALFVQGSDGFVGIGTNAPSARLHVKESVFANTPIIERTGRTTDVAHTTLNLLATKTSDMGDGFGSMIYFKAQDDTSGIKALGHIGAVRDGADTKGALIFNTIDTTDYERMRITYDGKVGIGTGSSPATLLEIQDTDAHPVLTITNKSDVAYDPSIQFRVGSTPATKFTLGVDDSTTNNDFVISRGATLGTTNALSIDGSNGAVFMLDVKDDDLAAGNPVDLFIDSVTGQLGINTSSERYKENIIEMENTDWIYDLRPVNFNYLNNPEKRNEYGLIAEEVEQINPYFVFYNNDSGLVQGVNYSRFISPIIKTLQDQKQTISDMQQVTSDMQDEISNMQQATCDVQLSTNIETLTVTDKITTAQIEVTDKAIFKGEIVVEDKAIFMADIEIQGHIIGNNDTRGTVTILAGETKAEFEFNTPYSLEPSIIATQKITCEEQEQEDGNMTKICDPILSSSYALEIYQEKFIIHLNESQDFDTHFNWQSQE